MWLCGCLGPGVHRQPPGDGTLATVSGTSLGDQSQGRRRRGGAPTFKDDFDSWMSTLDISRRDLNRDFLDRSAAALRSQADLQQGPALVKRRQQVCTRAQRAL